MNTDQLNDDFLQRLENDLSDLPLEKPSSNAKGRFMDFVEKETTIPTKETKVFSLKKWRFQTGIASIILISLGSMMYLQNKQNEALQNSLMAMNTKVEKLLDNESPTERIKAITVGYQPEYDVNSEMLTTLFDVLKNDQSSNVRQTAVETLAYYIDREEVRSGLIKALPEEENMIVKLSIIQTIAMKNDNKSKDVLEAIIKNNNQDPFIVNEANMQLTRFKQY